MTEPAFRIMNPSALPEEDRSVWIELLRQYRWNSPLLHPDFAQLVGQCRADTRIIIGMDSTGKRAFLPVQLRPESVCRPIGAVYSDLHDLIAEDGCALGVVELLRGVGLKSYRFLALLSAHGGSDGEACHYDARLHDGAAFENLRSSSAKSFKKFGRLARKLEREIGSVELCVDDPDVGCFKQLMQWKQDQYARTGKHNVLAPQWVEQMMQTFHADRASEISGRLITLRANGQLLAAEFGPFGGGVFHPWIAAYNADFSRYSPGILLMRQLFEGMPDNGIWRYDLGISDTGYKSAFANVFLPTFQGSLEADGSGGNVSMLSRLSRQPGITGKIGRRWERIILCETTRMQQLRGLLLAARNMF